MSKKTLQDKIRDWIEQEGYPFEMSTAKIFRENNLNVYESNYYEDTETGKYREIDLIAYFSRYLGYNTSFQVKFIIECKYAKDKPWVMFHTPDKSYESMPISYKLIGNEAGKELLETLNGFDEKTIEYNLLLNDVNFGYGIIEALKGSNKSIDLAYKSADSVFKALESELDKGTKNTNTCELYIPIIVIRGSLFECSQEHEKINIREVDSGTLVWKKKLDSIGFGFINVVTEKHLDQFVKKMKSDLDHIIENRKDLIEGAINRNRRKRKNKGVRVRS